ncbi:MAG: hypothetical protein K8L97_29275 [Anaerolineae bacterium]|nr:hypothetical protein [Anaerolineae bacterium]
MQISRHWRLNSQRYRLQGVRYETGEVSLQARPNPLNTEELRATVVRDEKKVKAELKAAS